MRISANIDYSKSMNHWWIEVSTRHVTKNIRITDIVGTEEDSVNGRPYFRIFCANAANSIGDYIEDHKDITILKKLLRGESLISG